MPPRPKILLTILEAAERHSSPRSYIDKAIKEGRLRVWRDGRTDKVSQNAVDRLPKYVPPKEYEPESVVAVFTPSEVELLSYGLSVAITLHERGDFLSNFEEKTIRALQVKFFNSDQWERV